MSPIHYVASLKELRQRVATFNLCLKKRQEEPRWPRMKGGMKNFVFDPASEPKYQALRASARQAARIPQEISHGIISGAVRDSGEPSSPRIYPDEIEPDKSLIEGASKQVTVNQFERILPPEKPASVTTVPHVLSAIWTSRRSTGQSPPESSTCITFAPCLWDEVPPPWTQPTT